jgi:pimeloyl-ACP methyl ester carboxylesterase
VSTPTSLVLPDGVQRTEVKTGRGWFAALEALPVPGVCERETALLVPGYTGSKEDFLALLDQLAAAGRRVVAIDMRGQYQTPGPASLNSPASTAGPASTDCYTAAALGADIAAIVRATQTRHLLGHSYGGLVAREAMLDCLADDGVKSLTLMSSGPGALTGPRADELRAMLAALGALDGDVMAATLPIAELWKAQLEPQAVAAGVPEGIVAFLGERMLSNDPEGLVAMARHLLSAPDRTDELARLTGVRMLVVYGENDNSWSPGAQEEMARRLGAMRVCIPGAVHSPNVEAPATTASALTAFWDAAEKA